MLSMLHSIYEDEPNNKEEKKRHRNKNGNGNEKRIIFEF